MSDTRARYKKPWYERPLGELTLNEILYESYLDDPKYSRAMRKRELEQAKNNRPLQEQKKAEQPVEPVKTEAAAAALEKHKISFAASLRALQKVGQFSRSTPDEEASKEASKSENNSVSARCEVKPF